MDLSTHPIAVRPPLRSGADATAAAASPRPAGRPTAATAVRDADAWPASTAQSALIGRALLDPSGTGPDAARSDAAVERTDRVLKPFGVGMLPSRDGAPRVAVTVSTPLDRPALHGRPEAPPA